MKTIKELLNEGAQIADVIKVLTKKNNPPPEWSELKKEYDPKLHPVMDTSIYQDKHGKKGPIKVTRATRGLQRRAVKTMAGMMFGIPVTRVYNTQNPAQEKAAAIIEKIIEANRIDSVNISRAIKLFASCEAMTLWYASKDPNTTYGEPSQLKLRCRTLSAMDEDKIYPLFDEYGDLVALSIQYASTEDDKTVTYFDSYTATEHYKWKQVDGEWKEIEVDEISIGKIPAAYITRSTPIWENSNNVTEIEWALSRNGNYLRRNSVPIYEIREDGLIDFGKENDDDERIVMQLSASGQSGYKTWPQAIESLKFHVEELSRAFFSDIQLPNFSSDEMKSASASGESKRYMFMDATIKVLEEQGAWLEFLSRELSVIKAFAKIAFPAYATAFDELKIDNIITPFSMTDEKDTVNNASAAFSSGIVSRKTAVSRLGWVSDIQKEIEDIAADKMSDISEPTM